MHYSGIIQSHIHDSNPIYKLLTLHLRLIEWWNSRFFHQLIEEISKFFFSERLMKYLWHFHVSHSLRSWLFLYPIDEICNFIQRLIYEIHDLVFWPIDEICDFFEWPINEILDFFFNDRLAKSVIFFNDQSINIGCFPQSN